MRTELKLNVMAESVKKLDFSKILDKLSSQFEIKRIEPSKHLKWDKSKCPLCYGPKEQCWDNGDSQPDLE